MTVQELEIRKLRAEHNLQQALQVAKELEPELVRIFATGPDSVTDAAIVRECVGYVLCLVDYDLSSANLDEKKFVADEDLED